MKILVKKTILFYIDKYPIAKTQLLIWYNEFSKLEFHNFNELKQVYGNASIVTMKGSFLILKGMILDWLYPLIFYKQPVM